MRNQFHSQKIKSYLLLFIKALSLKKKKKKMQKARVLPETRIFTWEVGDPDIVPTWEILEDGFELACK